MINSRLGSLSLLLSLVLLPISAFAYNPHAPSVGADFSGLACQQLAKGYGPYDYTKPDERPKIPIVEQYHFTPNVENLVRGESGYIEGDLDYTLRAVPNHHRALLSLIRLQLKVNSKLARLHAPFPVPVECYLQRAINYSPRDAGSMSLYAYYLKENKQYEKAASVYETALSISPNNAKVEYSYASVLIDLKQYDKALEHAKKAYSLGNPPKGLKNRLIKLGVWK